MCIATLAFASAGLLHPHVPFDEAANLTLGIAASHHALDKLGVLLFGIAVLFRTKRDNRKKILPLREYPFLDHLAHLSVARSRRILPAILGPRPLSLRVRSTPHNGHRPGANASLSLNSATRREPLFDGTVIGRQLLISIRHLRAAFRPSASNTVAGVNDVQGCAVRSP